MFSGCGIAGYVNFGPDDSSLVSSKVEKMLKCLSHRGPDGQGLWQQENQAILGHRRLSILGLGQEGAQPMTRDELTITYNGELYNFQEIKKQLASFSFHSHTDTEIVLRAFQKWGAKALNKFNGMYAFGIWNSSEKELYLVRDRVGIKPLYYFQNEKYFIFASEVEALVSSGLVPKKINEKSFHRQLLCSSPLDIDQTETLIEGVKLLPPGHFLKVNKNGKLDLVQYWSLPDSQNTSAKRSRLVEEYSQLIKESVSLMLMGDVPVSAFLSGGVDSSAIVALAGQSETIRALTISYEIENDDVVFSKILAKSLGPKVDHKIIGQRSTVDIGAIDAICDLAAVCEDVRQINILNNYKAVKEAGLKVVLNGQGADETMGGYIALPHFIKSVCDVKNPDFEKPRAMPLSRVIETMEFLNPEVLKNRDKIYSDFYSFYMNLKGDPVEKIHRLLYHLQINRILKFEDYLSMQTSVECRVPFLDHRLVEWCFKHPFSIHYNTDPVAGKTILREAMIPFFPKELLTRPKQVFPFPDMQAVTQSLRDLFIQNKTDILNCEAVQQFLNIEVLQNTKTLPTNTAWLALFLWRWNTKLNKA